jgi:transcriptional regulator with XRE-family HTH domain
MRSYIDQYIIDRVREIRKLKKISQETLAYKLDFESKGYIGAIESMNEERTECYNIKHLNQIAKILECSPQDFWPLKPIESYVSPRAIMKKHLS